MCSVTAETIEQCSLKLGRFDSANVNLLVKLFHHQNTCSKLVLLSHNLKEKFENLLTTNRDNDENSTDTPLTRIELAIMVHFKDKYLSELSIDNDKNQLKPIGMFSVDDELNSAYCFLLAQIDDRLSEEFLYGLKFLLGIRRPVHSLFDIYISSGRNFPSFFSLLIQNGNFAQNLVIADQTMRGFQLFIARYEDFLITFEKHYKILSENANNFNDTDAILNQTESQEISSAITKVLASNGQTQKITTSVEQVPNVSVAHSILQRSAPSTPSSSNVTKKGLCVIINIKEFITSHAIATQKRSGSDKDVDLIKVIFNKLKFTILECKFDFKKTDLEAALNHIDDPNLYGNFDCLVIFIMSHGFLHSLLTADSKEFVIRDIIKRYADSSPKTIWTGKPRLFFIQACRSLRPVYMQPTNHEGVKKEDLSPKMLVAYSCSASQASKRSPTTGSCFIQVLCIMILRYSHCHSIHTILFWTEQFVTTLDKRLHELKEAKTGIQKPEFIERDFSPYFRFSNSCLCNTFSLWKDNERLCIEIPWAIWHEIYFQVPKNSTANHNVIH